jgi:endonuclease/exonuclease/phosphatase family metal-dependent hydrolase
VQTHKHARSSKPWCNDYAFTTTALGRRVTRCSVDEGSWAVSDHGAIIVEVRA